jgi:hypothetical protein
MRRLTPGAISWEFRINLWGKKVSTGEVGRGKPKQQLNMSKNGIRMSLIGQFACFTPKNGFDMIVMDKAHAGRFVFSLVIDTDIIKIG